VIFPDFDPYVFGLHWNGFGVRWYALAYVAGILLGWTYISRLARSTALWGGRGPLPSREQIDDLVLWVTLGVIVGGRLGSVLFYDTAIIWREPLEIFKIWKGGMSFHGGLIGVTVALILYARSQKFDPLLIGDLVAPAVPIGLFFGRLANFVNGELWGRPTDLPWGFITKDSVVPLHPSQLYEAALEGVVLFIILRLATHKFGQLKRRGAVMGAFLAGYGLFRMLVENVRAPDAGLDNWPLGLTMGMVLSAPMFLIGLWFIYRSRDPKNTGPSPAPEIIETEPKSS